MGRWLRKLNLKWGYKKAKKCKKCFLKSVVEVDVKHDGTCKQQYGIAVHTDELIFLVWIFFSCPKLLYTCPSVCSLVCPFVCLGTLLKLCSLFTFAYNCLPWLTLLTLDWPWTDHADLILTLPTTQTVDWPQVFTAVKFFYEIFYGTAIITKSWIWVILGYFVPPKVCTRARSKLAVARKKLQFIINWARIELG